MHAIEAAAPMLCRPAGSRFPALRRGLAIAGVLAPWLALAAHAAPAIRLVPRPAVVDSLGGAFAIPRDPSIVLDSTDPDDRWAADQLADELSAAGAGRATIAARGRGAFVLARTAADTSLGDEGYRLECGEAGVRIEAPSSAGLYYGVQTLRQLVTSEGISFVRVRDRPALRWRGIHEDISRAGVPRVEALEQRIAFAASLKLNLYMLYSEVSIASASQPLLAQPGNALTPEDVGTLREFARRHHVRLALAQQSLGHAGEILRHDRYRSLALHKDSDVLAPDTPATYAFLDSLYSDLVPLFDGPFVHVGADEPGDLDQRSAGRVVVSGDERFGRHIAHLSTVLAGHDRRLMLWSDYPLAHHATIRTLPRDGVVAIWDFNVKPAYDSLITPFRAAGLDVIVCPGLMNWERLFPRVGDAALNAARMTRDGVRAGAIGQMACAWADNGEFTPGVLAYPLAYSAGAAWSGERAPTEDRFAADFDWAAFRAPGHDIARAVQLLSGIHDRFESTGGPDANIRLLELDPLHPADHRLLEPLDTAATVAARAAEQAIELLARGRAAARSNREYLDDHVFAARRLHAFAIGLDVGHRWLALYRTALADQKAGRVAAAARGLTGLGDLTAAARNEAFDVRAEHQRLLALDVLPGRRDLLLLRDDRACRRWSDLCDLFSRLAVWCQLGQPLPAERALPIP